MAVSVTISLLMVVHRSSRARMSILVSASLALDSFGTNESISPRGECPGRRNGNR